LLPSVLNPTLAPDYALSVSDGDRQLYFRASQDEQRGRAWERQVPLQFENVTWTLKLWPAPAALSAVTSSISTMVLGAGLVLSLLLGAAVYLAQTAWLKTRQAELARQEL